MDYADYTDEKLLAEKQSLQMQRDEIKAKQHAIQAELDRRSVAAKLGGLSASEVESLSQILEARGIASTDKVGKPGAK